jgi:diguanylate cyclase (GGDEF)-like protein
MNKTNNYLSLGIIFIISSCINFIILTYVKIKFFNVIPFLFTAITIIIAIIFYIKSYRGYNTLNTELKETLKVRDALLGLSQTALKLSSEQELYDLFISVAVDVIENAHMGSIILVNDDNNLEYKSSVEFDLDKLKESNIKLEETYIYLAGKGNINNTVIINNAIEFNKNHNVNISESISARKLIEIKSTISSPIIIQNELHGIINIDSRTPYAFNEFDIELIHFFTYEIGKIIQLYKSIAKNLYLSRHDYLTNIYNRRFFHDAINNLLSNMDSNDIFSLISIDLDNLKIANDNYGHHIGDMLIINFVNTMKEFLCDKDIFSRFGGDEFIIVLFNRSKKESKIVIEKSKEKMSLITIDIQNNKLCPTYSYGVAQYPQDSTNYKELITLADQYMYENKRGK